MNAKAAGSGNTLWAVQEMPGKAPLFLSQSLAATLLSSLSALGLRLLSPNMAHMSPGPQGPCDTSHGKALFWLCLPTSNETGKIQPIPSRTDLQLSAWDLPVDGSFHHPSSAAAGFTALCSGACLQEQVGSGFWNQQAPA